MSVLDAILLGIIQGLTEFLPVSSSGHLVIAQNLLEGFHQEGVLFDVMLHLGTLLAVVFFLWREIHALLISLIPRRWRHGPQRYDETALSTRRNIAFLILVGTAVTGMIGITFKHEIHRLFQSVEIVAGMLIVTGILLFVADRVKNATRTEGAMNISDALIIGLAQAFALVPGISRSGSTIAFGMFRNIDGETAARFSFLLSIPAILGAAVLELEYITNVTPGEVAVYLTGMTAAAVTGFFALKLLFFMVKKRGLRIFSYYCWFVGITTITMTMI